MKNIYIHIKQFDYTKVVKEGNYDEMGYFFNENMSID